MIKNIQNSLKIGILFLAPTCLFGQTLDLGIASEYVLFSTDGPVTNSGISHLTGNVGTNNGSSTGFGNVNGVMHDADVSSAQCAVDLLIAYNDLNSRIPAFFPAPLLGNGQTLNAGVYEVSGASSLNLELILDAQNDPTAVFVFQLQGPFSTNANSKVKLINGAKACNVYWKVEGLVDMATGTSMKGTLIANNAGINFNTGDTLEGRAFSTTGAITLDGILAYTPNCGEIALTGPIAPDLGLAACFGVFSSDGPVVNSGISNVTGDVGANVGLTSGFDPLLVSGNIHPIPDAFTATCASDLLLAYNYLNGLTADIELLYPAQFGANLVLTPHTYVLNGATTFTDTLYLDARGNANAVFALKLNGALSTSTFSKVILINGAQAENVYWMVNGAVDINDYSIFKGTIVSQGAINLYSGTTIYGRVLSGVGAIETVEINSLSTISAGDCAMNVGMNDLTKNNELSVFPNPFESKISIDLNDFNESNIYMIKLKSSVGQELLTQKLVNQLTELNLENLSSGVYFFEITSNGILVSSGKLIAKK
ncbi:MAG: ice-binding family protein [Flavobacteriia bacterium]